MADYEDDAAYEDAPPQEELVLETDVVEEEQTTEQRAEAADLLKLLKQHPEIWIPYEEQIQERLNTQQGPGTEVPTADAISLLPKCGLRDTSMLDAAHTTYPFLTNYERTKCISYRASQICNGAKPYILVPEGVTDSYEIAKLELEAKRLPFIVKRPLPDGMFEAWRLTDLLLL